MPFMNQAATAADKVDSVFLYILALSVAFLVFITFLLIFFVIKYSRKRNPKPQDIHGHTGLEITWTVVPLILFVSMFYYGWTNYEYLRDAPRDAMEVVVTGRQWAWQFEYPNGKKTEELYAAIDRPVRLLVHSADVIHGFYVPAFRIKVDAVPGAENYTWFQPTQYGSFAIECTVICGVDHSYMISYVNVVPEDDFRAWYLGGDEAPLPDKAQTASVTAPDEPDHPGFAVLKAKQCLTCHSTDGRVMVGPTFKGVFGSKQVVKLGDEVQEVLADQTYLKTAIQDPLKEIVKGYPAVMPKPDISTEEIERVIDYIQSLQ